MMLYPCLSFDLACWMTREQSHILKDGSYNDLSSIRSRSKVSLVSPLAVPAAPREIYLLKNEVDRSDSWYIRLLKPFYQVTKKEDGMVVPTELSMTSRMSYFNDRIIQPEGKSI
jgi:hypothetical protein